MSRLFSPSHGIGLLATEILRKPSARERLISQALAQRTLLTNGTLPLLVQEVLRQPSPPTPKNVEAIDPAAHMASLANRWQLALGVVSSTQLKRAAIRPDPSVWGVIEKSAPDAASKAACAAALKQLYRPATPKK